MNKVLASLLLLATWGFCAVEPTYAPNPRTGMITMSIHESSVSSFLKVYENAGRHDFGMFEMIGELNETLKEKGFDAKVTVSKLYFHDFTFNLNNDEINVGLKNSIDINANVDLGPITLKPKVSVGSINASASMMLKNTTMAPSDIPHINFCLSNLGLDVSNFKFREPVVTGVLSFVTGIVPPFINWIVDAGAKHLINSTLKSELGKLVSEFGCVDLANQLGVTFPSIMAPVTLQRTRVEIKNNSFVASSCPVPTKEINGTVSVSDDPCELMTYKFKVHTSNIGSAGTDSKISLNFCGKDDQGTTRCMTTMLNDMTERGDISEVSIDSKYLLTDNLSVTLNSDNSGHKPGWFVDSVTVDYQFPNDERVHRWFPFHKWVEKGNLSVTATPNTYVYRITVATGENGTDNDVYASICGTMACVAATLENPDHDDFKANSVDQFIFTTNKDIGIIKEVALYKSIRYTYNTPNLDTDMLFINTVKVEKYKLSESRNINEPQDSKQFAFFQRFNEKMDDQKIYSRTVNYGDLNLKPENGKLTVYPKYYRVSRNADHPVYFYHIGIKTGNDGTNASVKLTLRGCNGSQVSFDLDNDDHDDFEKGHYDEFWRATPINIGEIKEIEVQHDNSGKNASWEIASMSVDGIGSTGNHDELRTYLFNDKNVSLPDDKTVWKAYSNTSCPVDMRPVITNNVIITYPGAKITFTGSNLNSGVTQNAAILNMNNSTIYVMNMKSTSIDFLIPENTPIAEYANAELNVNGTVFPVYISVRGKEPVINEISATVVHPGDAIIVKGSNIDNTATFYIDGQKLVSVIDKLNRIIIKIPEQIRDGVYPLIMKQGAWNVDTKMAVRVTNPDMPHVYKVSEEKVHVNDIVKVYGSNFGDFVNELHVFISGVEAKVITLNDTEIQIVIPNNVSGNKLPIVVKRNSKSSNEIVTINVEPTPMFFSFDDPAHPWTSQNATLSYDNDEKIGFNGFSLKVHGPGYKTVVSPEFETSTLGKVTKHLLLDVWIPEDQLTPYWYGDIQMFLDIHEANLYNAWLGIALLSDLKPGWNTAVIELSDEIYNVLQGNYSGAQLTIAVNANQGEDDYRIDNLRFGTDDEIPASKVILAFTDKNSAVKVW